MSLQNNNIWSILVKTNWKSTDFSLDKAYLCSFFSKIAYEHIPEFELKQSNRIKIIPSFKYAEMLKEGKSSNVRDTLQGLDFQNVFIIETRLVIIVGIRTQNVTIVAIRGTDTLNDWKVNLNIKRVKCITDSEIKFHKGFYKAISECFKELYVELEESKVPIYVTGHSLGGAMSAILHANWGENKINSKSTQYYPFCMPHVHIHSCYTFGMPRYGNKKAMKFLPIPFHFYNEFDVVPAILPKWLGFESCKYEFKINSKGIIMEINKHNNNFFKCLHRLTFGESIFSHHDIEVYNKNLNLIKDSKI